MSHPSSMIQNILWDSFHSIGEPLLMHWPFSKLRQEALCHVMEHIHYEDENTNYICLAPISKVIVFIHMEELIIIHTIIRVYSLYHN